MKLSYFAVLGVHSMAVLLGVTGLFVLSEPGWAWKIQLVIWPVIYFLATLSAMMYRQMYLAEKANHAHWPSHTAN